MSGKIVEDIGHFMTSLIDEKTWESESFKKKISKLKFLPRYFPGWASKVLPFDADQAICFDGSVEYAGATLAWMVQPSLHKEWFSSAEDKAKLGIIESEMLGK